MSQPNDPDPRPGGTPAATPVAGTRAPVTDDELGALVRDVADGWAMPPIRLDQAGWRERVRSPRARRAATLRGWTGRVGQAAAAALVLTVGAALLGVMLTRPTGPGQSQGPTGSKEAGRTVRPGPTAVPPSPLPKLLVDGDVPTPSQLIVNAESQFAVVDLATGTLGRPLASGQYGTVLRRAPDGSLYCVCLTGDSYTDQSFSHMTATWSRYVDGTASGTVTVGEYRGAPTPTDRSFQEQPQHVAVRVTFGADPGLAFVGWTVHAHPAWKSGLVVVDVTDGTVIQRVDLPDRADGDETSRTGADAPQVIGTAGAGRFAIERPWYRWSPAASSSPSYQFGGDTYVASSEGNHLSNITPLAAASQCGDQATESGSLAGGSWWLACTGDEYRQIIVRRLASDDRALGDSQVFVQGGFVADSGGTSAVSPDGKSLFIWGATDLALTRVDLATGTVSTGSGHETALASDPLSALGRWLTPTAEAKVILSSGIAVSPDGTRIYALGITNDPTGQAEPGSAGLFVFDTATLAQVDRWTPTADFVSLAVSADGRFVYAAGSPMASADGKETTQPASITVFDATNGSVRLIAGQLGGGMLLFPSTTVR